MANLAEVLGCTEIAQAVLAKSRPRLVLAIDQDTLSVNQPNALGQTPLHLSVYWPEGMRVLLNAGAAMDAADKEGYTPIFYAAAHGLLDAILMLSEAGCAFHNLVGYRKKYPYLLLEGTIKNEYCSARGLPLAGIFQGTRNATEVFDVVLQLVVQRRRTLEGLARASLSEDSVRQLGLSPENILDRKASIAESMLRKRLHVPESLVNLSPPKGTVYHCAYLNLRQAAAFWEAGFRNVDELDGRGQSPLMMQPNSWFGLSGKLNVTMELQLWFVMHGADIHRRQKYAWQLDGRVDGFYNNRRASPRHQVVSSTTALHYLANGWGREIYRGLDWGRQQMPEEPVLHSPLTLTDKSKTFMRTVLTDTVCDRCNCACSAQGCRAYTMIEKSVLRLYLKYSIPRPYLKYSRKDCREAALNVTLALAGFLGVDQSDLELLRRDMLRVITFNALRLRHTCCAWHGGVIAEFADEENRDEVREEQKEQVEILETLLPEFESKLKEMAIPFVQFVKGCWRKRMRDVRRESRPFDENKLRYLGVQLQEIGCHSSSSSDDEEEDDEDEEKEEQEEAEGRNSI